MIPLLVSAKSNIRLEPKLETGPSDLGARRRNMQWKRLVIVIFLTLSMTLAQGNLFAWW